MAQRTIARMYDTYDAARSVVNDLEASGVPHSDISLVANAEAQGRSSGTSGTAAVTGGGTSPADPANPSDTDASAGGKRGAVLGTALGGGVGLLAGIGSLAIPGVGPVVAAGWLIATLTGAGVGAASGGLLGSLTGAGVSKDEANVYAEGVRGGGSLVTVRVDEAEAARVEAVMGQHGPVDWQQRRASYGADWSGFEASGKVRTSASPLGLATGADVPGTGAGGSYAPGTDPGRRL